MKNRTIIQWRIEEKYLEIETRKELFDKTPSNAARVKLNEALKVIDGELAILKWVLEA